MFQLTENEFENLRCKNFTSSWGGSRYLPNAFTEQGIYMIMTVLRGELAIRQSRALIRTFKQMKDFIIENQDFIGSKELVQIAIQTNKNTNGIAKIKHISNKRRFEKGDLIHIFGYFKKRDKEGKTYKR